MRTSGKSLRSKRAGLCQRRKGPTAPRWELQSSHSHQEIPIYIQSAFVSFTNAQFQCLVFVPQYIRRPTCDGIAELIFLCTAGRFYLVLICCNSVTGRDFAIIRDTIFRIRPNLFFYLCTPPKYRTLVQTLGGIRNDCQELLLNYRHYSMAHICWFAKGECPKCN